MAEFMTIGRLARAARMPVSTLRFYEREGLLQPDRRSTGNYRLYGPDALERLSVIGVARAHGLTLADLRGLLEAPDRASMERRFRATLRRRMGDVQRESLRLRRVLRRIRRTLRGSRGRRAQGIPWLSGLRSRSRQSLPPPSRLRFPCADARAGRGRGGGVSRLRHPCGGGRAPPGLPAAPGRW